MFDFKNNDANLVIIQDSDFIKNKLDELFNIINNLDLYNKNKYKDYYILKLSDINSIFDNHNVFYKNILNSYTVASGFVSINKINNNILIEYIKSVKNNVFSYFSNSNNNNDNKFIGTNNFIYGVDEYFLNNHLIKYIIDNKLCFININLFDLFTRIYKYFKYYENNNDNNILMDKLFNLLLNKLKLNYNNLSIKDKYIIINNLIIDENKNEIVYKLLYKLFLIFYTKQTYKFLFPENLYKIILKNKYFGLYKFKIIIFEFDNKNNIIEKKQFDDEYLNKLKNYLNKKKIKLPN